MSNQDDAQEQPDPIKNLKAEMERKLGNVADTLKKQNEALEAYMRAQAPASPKQVEENLEDLIYSDPKRYAQIIEDRAVAKAEERVLSKTQKSNQINNTIAALSQDYPELQSDGSELTKKALEIYKSLGEEGAAAIRAAVREAAVELGVQPMSKRKNTDDYSFGSGGNVGRQPRKEREPELDQETIDLARLLNEGTGRDVNSPEFKKRLLEREKNIVERVTGRNKLFNKYK
jgi:hypothetical protein